MSEPERNTKDEFCERKKKSFDFAADTTKQLITISTAVITLTVTFSRNFYTGNEIPSSLLWSWTFYFCSILFGVFTLLTLTGNLGNNKAVEMKDLSIYSPNIIFGSIIQNITFLAGLLAFIVFAFGL